MSLSLSPDDEGEWALRARRRRFDRTVAVLSAVALAAGWAVLAWRSPFSTRHFAPLLVAMSTPVMLRHRIGRVAAFEARALTILSVSLAIMTALGLSIADKMQGPSFWSAGGALVEALLLAIVGGVAGMAVIERAPDKGGTDESDIDQPS